MASGTAIVEHMAGDASSHHSRRGGGHADSRRAGVGSGANGRAMRRIAGLESDIRLSLPARPENVAVVRHVLSALAEALALPRPVVEDMRLAVTEACTNVVRHAYGARIGTVDVAIRPNGESLVAASRSSSSWPTRGAAWARAPTSAAPASGCRSSRRSPTRSASIRAPPRAAGL
jgi:hypothetical protein